MEGSVITAIRRAFEGEPFITTAATGIPDLLRPNLGWIQGQFNFTENSLYYRPAPPGSSRFIQLTVSHLSVGGSTLTTILRFVTRITL